MSLTPKQLPIALHIAQTQAAVAASSTVASLISNGTLSTSQVNSIVATALYYLRQGE